MNSRLLLGLCAMALVTAVAWPDQSTAQERTVVVKKKTTRVARAPSRITVHPRRSYLDAGTEVKPGDRNFLGYVWGTPGYTSYTVFDPARSNSIYPLPDRFWLPGYSPNPFD